MKKLFTLVLVASLGVPMWSCEYDDDDLWKAVDELDGRVETLEKAAKQANSDIASLQGLVDALQKKVSVESVVKTEEGYTIHFSNGETAAISNGKNGLDAPVVAVKQDTDGIWYWTLGGEWLTDGAGNKIKAAATDGAPGDDAVAPKVRINADTKEWEISTDNGGTWTSTGVVAEGRDGAAGDSIFRSVNADDPDWVVFTLKDNTVIRLPRSGSMSFVIEGLSGEAEFFRFGATRTWTVAASGVADYTISRPDGWKVSYAEGMLSVTAPAAENAYADLSGEIAVHAVSETGFSRIVKMRVEAAAFQLRVLTFEDEDYKGTGNFLGNKDWTSLVDSKQYNGPLLYPSEEELYRWDDTNNTFLASELPNGFGDYKYWGGGHAVSNYIGMDVENASFTTQLSVYYTDPVTGFGGHEGSKNFCVHYGCSDVANPTNLPNIYFYDGVARVVDHMWVMNTSYTLNSVLVGDSFSGAPFGKDDYLKVIATGYNADGEKAGTCEIMLAQGADNYLKEWTCWDLSPLGEVLMIEFNIDGSRKGSYGLNTPAYFAYDDVAVRF